MVAITVILAAVIGAFVLEIGDQQETAPSTSFDTEQLDNKYFSIWSGACSNPRDANLTQVYIDHAGGDVLDITQSDIKVEGNGSVWGFEREDPDDGSPDWAKPQPDVRRTLGTNEPQEFSSGQRWNVIAYNNMAPSDEYVVDNPGHDKWPEYRLSYTPDCGSDDDDPAVKVTWNDPNTGWTGRQANILRPDDSVNVVWTASSGGKTQTLFKYSVQ
jgi:hypothetical protein